MNIVCCVCRQSVACGERVGKDGRGNWCHTLCAAGDGPYIQGPTYTNHPAYFVFVIDPENPRKKGLLLGPYETPDEALANVNRGRELAKDADPWAGFYGYGIASGEERKTVFGV